MALTAATWLAVASNKVPVNIFYSRHVSEEILTQDIFSQDTIRPAPNHLELSPLILPAFKVEYLTVSESHINFLKEKEGLRLRAYQDSGGTWTIGYGHTGRMPDGTPVGKGKKISREEAESLLRRDIAVHAEKVRRLLGETPVTRSQFEALVDFSFNKGITRLKSSTLLKMVQEARYIDASDEFLRWIYVTRYRNGNPITKKLPGLEERARSNQKMMLAGLPEIIIPVLEQARRLREKARFVQKNLLLQTKTVLSNENSDKEDAVQILQTLKNRVGDHIDYLDHQADTQRNLIAEIRQERIGLVNIIHDMSMVQQTAFDEEEVIDVLDLIAQNAVLKNVEARMLEEHGSTIDLCKEMIDTWGLFDHSQKVLSAGGEAMHELSFNQFNYLREYWQSLDSLTISGFDTPLVAGSIVRIIASRFSEIEDDLRMADASSNENQWGTKSRALASM